MVMERVRQAYPRRSSNEVAPTDIEVLTWWNNLLNGIESSPSGAGSSEDQSLATSEEMETLRAMSVDEIDQMAQQFLQDRNSEEEKEEEGHNDEEVESEEISNTLNHLPVASRISSLDMTAVSGENNEGNDDVDRETVLTGSLLVDSKVLREPIYNSMPWLTPLFLLIMVASLLVILVVSLSVAFTNTGQPEGFSTTSPFPTLSVSPTISATFQPSALPSLRPSFAPSAPPTEHPSVSVSPTALPTMVNLTWRQVGNNVTGADDEYLGFSMALSANGNVLGVLGTKVLRVYLLTGMVDWVLHQEISNGITDLGKVSVSLDGLTIVASNPYHNRYSGRVLVYRRVGANWEQCGDPLVGEDRSSLFGFSVALSGNGTVLAVGDCGGGYVHVYRDEEGASGNRTLVTRIEGVRGGFGFVAASADATRLIVGAPRSDDGTGEAFVYSLFPAHTLLQRMRGDEAGETFGNTVAASSNGEVFAVASLKPEYVKVYVANDSSRRQYSQLADRINAPQFSSDFGRGFGRVLSLSGDGTRLAVGGTQVYQNAIGSGRAFVYAVHPRRHQRIGEFEGDSIGNAFGYSVSLSGDGTRLAVSDPYWSHAGGEDGGLVRVFNLT